MKKIFIIIFLILSSAGTAFASFPNNAQSVFASGPREFFGQSFMFTHPIFMRSSTQQAIWHNQIYEKNGPLQASFQVTGAYQHSRQDCAVDRYFLLPCKNVLTVAGDDTVDKDCRDVRAEWINLPSDFRGQFSLSPEQSQWGVMLEYNQDFCRLCDWGWFENYWFSIELPIVGVSNTPNLRQTVIEPGTPAPGQPADIIQAFNQQSWKFGKINGLRTKVELAAIRLRMGKAWLAKNNDQIAYYTGILFPTSSKQNPEFLFDPVTGLNGSVGLNAGVNFNVVLNRNADRYVFSLFANLDDTFLIRNDQCRTFGLIDFPTGCPKYLTRFIGLNRPNCPTEFNIPGVNVLTQLVRVKPFNIVDFSAGFRILIEDMIEAEFGFNIWGHGREQLVIKFPDFTQLELEKYGVAGTTAANSASLSTIAQQAPNDPVFEHLHISDLDYHSAESESVLNYIASGSVCAQFQGKINKFFGVGFFVEFPQKNAALAELGFWFKAGASF